MDRTTQRTHPARLAKRAWLAGLLLHAAPFVLVGMTVMDKTEEQRLEMVAEQFLGAELEGLESATDRAGSHLALIDAVGRIYRLGPDERLQDVEPVPASLRRADGRRLMWRDENLDGRYDLRVAPLWWGSDGYQPTGNVWLDSAADHPAWRPTAERNSVSYLASRQAVLNDRGEMFSLRVNDEPHPGTLLVAKDRRAVARVEGVPALCTDLDGELGDELLTVAPGRLPEEAVVRGFQLQGRHARQVWEQSFRIADCVFRAVSGDSSSASLYHAADWDGDGRATLVIGEPRRGRLTFWQWRDAPDDQRRGARRRAM